MAKKNRNRNTNTPGLNTNIGSRKPPAKGKQTSVGKTPLGTHTAFPELRSFSKQRSINDSGDIVVEGSECLGLTNQTIGLNFIQVLNPATWTGTRLSKLATLFEKFRFNAIEFIYVTANATTATGLSFMLVDKDPEDDFPNYNGASFAQTCLSEETSVVGPTWSNLTLRFRCKNVDRDTTYFIEPSLGGPADDRQTSQGTLLFYGPSTTAGLIHVRYQIVLMSPIAYTINSSQPSYGWSALQANTVGFNAATANSPLVMNQPTFLSNIIGNIMNSVTEVVFGQDISNIALQQSGTGNTGAVTWPAYKPFYVSSQGSISGSPIYAYSDALSAWAGDASGRWVAATTFAAMTAIGGWLRIRHSAMMPT